jgi:hypothetical protein
MSQNNVNVVATLNSTAARVESALHAVADAASQIGAGIPAAQQRAGEELASATERIKAGVACLASLAAATVVDCQDILAGLDSLMADLMAPTVAVPALPEPAAETIPLSLPPVKTTEPASLSGQDDSTAEVVSKAANGPVEGSGEDRPARVKLTWVRLSEGILDALDGTYRVERTGDGWTAYHGGTVLGTYAHHNTAKKAAADHHNGE